MKAKIKRRVVFIWGSWGADTDFVIEPTCSNSCRCEICKDAVWIQMADKPKVKR